jgi:hypothetical protein
MRVSLALSLSFCAGLLLSACSSGGASYAPSIGLSAAVSPLLQIAGGGPSPSTRRGGVGVEAVP